MDERDRTAAANALIHWFNSQEISPANAELIMMKVTAKILNTRFDRKDPDSVKSTLDEHHRLLAHETIEAIYAARKR